MLPIYATRGCYWGKCAFCSFYLTTSGKFRYRGAQRVVEDIKKLSDKYECTNFAYMDEAIPPKYLCEIADLLLQEGIKINWSTHTRFEKQYNEEAFRKLYAAGCYALGFGLESACNRVLKAMNKGTDVETVERVLAASKRAGIANHVSLFFGFPSETREEAGVTVQFVLDNLQNIDSICYESFNLVKGSKVFENAEKYGIAEMKCTDEHDMSMDFEYKVAAGLSIEEAVRIKEQFSDTMLELYKSIQLVNCHEGLYLIDIKGMD
jgi:anaerobic magnesium-protoporphyrin IX monomethyl ester cyclase